MEQYADVVLDLQGNAVQDAAVQVLNLNRTVAAIYDANGAQQANPIGTGVRGDFAFQVPNGKYIIEVKVNGTVYATIGPRTFYDPADDEDRITAADLSATTGADRIGTSSGVLSSVLSLFSKAASLAANTGAALIGYVYPASAAVPGGIDQVLNETVSVFRFMTKAQQASVRAGTGNLDLTAPIQAAVDFAYTNNIGTVWFPPGVYPVTTIKRNWDAVRSLKIAGAGKRSVQFKKFDNSTTPVFQWSANDNILETYSNFEGFTIIGTNKAHHGIQVVKCARFAISDVYIGGCDRAIDNQGSLVWYGQGLTLQGNNHGVKLDRAATAAGGYIYPNAVTLRDSQVCFNTTYGVEAISANGMRIDACDIERNGTAGNQDTGAVIYKQTNLEIGVASLAIKDTWFEGNYGWTVTMDNANTVTAISVTDVQIIASESGRAMRILSARSVYLRGVMALSPTDNISIAASHCTIENSTIASIADTSTRSTWLNVVTSNDPVNEGGFSNGLNVSNGKPLTLSWARGAGKFTITPDTVNGHADYSTPSGLHRFNSQIGYFATVTAANAKAQAMFVDAADSKLKFKDINGVVNPLY